ncbi:MAG: hypothetical protein IJS74_03685 [Clostridia bacterium]|nr:hypothetical protein [Clostridia bacterium]
MIHSLAGGKLQNVEYCDYAKVQLTQGNLAGKIFWYKSIQGVQVGDDVIVPFGQDNMRVAGKVIKIDKNVSSQVAPIPSKRAKQIIRKI